MYIKCLKFRFPIFKSCYKMHKVSCYFVSVVAAAFLPVSICYCNYPVHNELGRVPTGYELTAAVSVIRHGERTSFDKAPSSTYQPNFNLNQGENALLYDDYVRFWEQYKSTTRDVPFELDDVRENFVPGILTPRGVVQMVELGQKLRKLYGLYGRMQYHVESTSFARTYHSALALMYGFLGSDAMTVPVSVNRKSTRFCSRSWCKCRSGLSRYRKKLNEKYSSFYYEYITTEISSTVNDGNRILLEDSTKSSLSGVADLLLPYACRKGRWPCSQNGDRCFRPRDFEILNNFGNLLARRLSSSEEGQRKGLVEAMAVLKKWRDAIWRSRKETGPFFEVYSDHETALIAVLIGLGLFDGTIPPMASDIRMDILRKANTAHSYIRIFYNGVDVTKKTTFCRSSSNSMCNTKRFVEFMNRFIDHNDHMTNLFQQYCSGH